MSVDASRGYNDVASEFMAARTNIGVGLIRRWAHALSPRSEIIDIGAGHGKPLTAELLAAGHSVWAIDASPVLLRDLKSNFPQVCVACEAAEDSDFFERSFDAALMVGLIFLLDERVQARVLKRLQKAIKPNGKLLFSAPAEVGEWQDLLTEQSSWSLGCDEYRTLLEDAGFSLIATHEDEGRNHYYEACRNDETA